MLYDILIIGGGPAGVSGGIYAARKKMRAVLVTDAFGGQSFVSDDIQNWIGEISISGYDLAKKMEAHLRAQEGIEVREGEEIVSVKKAGGTFIAETSKGAVIEAKTILLTSGSKRKKLGVPGEKELESKGVFYCSICDAPIMKDKTAAVVGGGNSALEAVVDLIPYAKKIYLLHRRDELKGDAVTQDKIKKSDKVEIIWNAETKEIVGEKTVKGIVYEDMKTKEKRTLDVEGVFVEIGSVPSSHIIEGLVEKNKGGEEIVDHKTQRTSCEGVWAAGDVSDVLYKQNNISSGDAVKAVLNIHEYLHKKI